MIKRLASFMLALLLLITLFPAFGSTASAAYENTYSNTGNQAADIIGVAKTQLGYTEGSNNYTKYGERFNLANSPWCGLFVSWCAEQAGIPTSVLPRYFRSNPSGFGLKELDGTSYRPQPGDLFFKRSYSHVGLVYYVDGDYFYTLEGNSGAGSNKVVSQRKKISDFVFGHPNYYGSGDHSYSTGHESAHPHKEYKLCSHCSDKYYTGNTTTASDCTICIQNACSHEYGNWSKESESKHSKTCSLCSKTETASHNWKSGTIITEATCAKNGSQEESCPDCGAERTVTISKTGKHSYGETTFVDDENHRRECKVCHYEETEAHMENEQWLTDELAHWYECTDCGERYAYEEHSFPDGCETPCEICGYIPAEGHILSDTPECDDFGHLYTCKNCDKKVNYTDHHFSADCAETCDGCTYTRQTTHSFGDTWKTDNTQHWQECSVCGKKQAEDTHLPDESAKDWEDQSCTTCSLILRSGAEHIHTYHNIESDGRTHWGTCECGFEMANEAHSWSMQTKKCSVCNANSVTVTNTADTTELIYWAALALGSIGIFTVLALLLNKIGKKTAVKNRSKAKSITA